MNDFLINEIKKKDNALRDAREVMHEMKKLQCQMGKIADGYVSQIFELREENKKLKEELFSLKKEGV